MTCKILFRISEVLSTFPDMGILKQKREEAGLSLQGLADEVGVKKSTIASYERELTLNKQFVSYLLTLSQSLKLSPKAFKELCERLVK